MKSVMKNALDARWLILQAKSGSKFLIPDYNVSYYFGGIADIFLVIANVYKI